MKIHTKHKIIGLTCASKGKTLLLNKTTNIKNKEEIKKLNLFKTVIRGH